MPSLTALRWLPALPAWLAAASALASVAHPGPLTPTWEPIGPDAAGKPQTQAGRDTHAIPEPSPTQPGGVKVWVYMKDKGFADAADVDAAVRGLRNSADPRAVRRRELRRTRPGLFDETDLPVAPEYVGRLREAGLRVHIESRWLNAVSVWATPEQMVQLAALPFVTRVEPVRGGRRRELGPDPESLPPVEPPQPGFRGPPPPIEGLAYDQQFQIGLTAMHQMGFTGQGVVIGILDTGFKKAHAVFNNPQAPLEIVAEHDFIFDDGQTTNEAEDDPAQHNHGTYCLGLIGANSPGSYQGGAFDASFILCKTEDIRSETPIEEDNYVAGLEFVEMHGGDMMSASLGYIDWYTQADLDGVTTVTAIASNMATANGVICVNAAGNEGNDADPQTSHMLTPVDGLLVIGCGAVDSAGDIAGFSSDGPTADGRVKPEVLARGVNNDIIRAGNDTDFTSGSGTSFATPLVACVVGCLLQAHPEWTVAQMREYLMHSADYFRANGTFDPQYVRGFGIVNATLGYLDCNGNGRSDTVDISMGASDCDANGVPDSCQSPRPCPADFNGASCVSSQDIFDFLAAFFTPGSPAADFNRSGAVSSQDIFDFLAAFFTPCP